ALMPTKPLLKQFRDLAPSDFVTHPVWVGCHTLDYDEPWYDDTDEETFRPWSDAIPIEPGAEMFLVRASLTLADGTILPGFVTPQPDAADAGLGMTQPQLFSPDGRGFSFWYGISTPDSAEKRALYAALSKSPEAVFPITCSAAPDFTRGGLTISIPGFCSYGPDHETIVVQQ
ncbi:MAG: hypothetical protein ABMA01_23205, partial [Chthoniobacteraceae bacterium]